MATIWIADAVMPGEFMRRARRSASGEVSGTGVEDTANRAEPKRHQAAVRQHAHAERDIAPAVNQWSPWPWVAKMWVTFLPLASTQSPTALACSMVRGENGVILAADQRG
jgi:hypothetical protein